MPLGAWHNLPGRAPRLGVWPLTKRVAGPHRMRPRAGPHARTLGTLAWVPITQLTGFCVLTDIGAAKGEGHGKSGGEDRCGSAPLESVWKSLRGC